MDLNLVSLALADQCTGYGRANRNFSVLGLCLMITYDLIYHLIAGITIGQRHRSAEYDFVARQLGNLDDLRAREPIFDLSNLDVQKRLPFLGRVKLGILRQISVVAGLFNFANDFWPFNGF